MNINEIKHNLKTNVPVFKAGDTVRVKVKVVEGDNERLQAFDGVVIARRGSGISETFTVRKISFGVGVERIFPIHSPRVDSIEVLKIGKVRRAKLNYLTKLSGKAARLQEVKKVTSNEAAAPAAEISNDEPQTKKADTMEKTLKIEGMMCAHCQKHVHDALAKMDGVTDVTVDLEGGSADVKATRDIPQDEFQKDIADVGYELVG